MASTTLLLAIVAALSAPPIHVRTGSTRIAEIVDFGAERSLLFRQLLDTLEHSGLVVHIAQGPCPGARRPACTHLVAGTRARVLQIHVDGSESVRTMLGLLAHEFQHAIEIAAAPEVTDVASLRRLYERIGYPDCAYGQHECWETQAAQSAEREVVRQALSARPTVDQAFFGEWHLDVQASTSSGLHAPRSGIRHHRHQGYGLVSVVLDIVDEGGTEHRDAFVYRADGDRYPIYRDGEEDPLSIAATAVDRLRSTFIISRGGSVLCTGSSTLDPRHQTLTLETRGTRADGGPWTAVEVWRKTTSSSRRSDRASYRAPAPGVSQSGRENVIIVDPEATATYCLPLNR